MRPVCHINDLGFTYRRDEDTLEIEAACELKELDQSNGRLVSIADLAGHVCASFSETRKGTNSIRTHGSPAGRPAVQRLPSQHALGRWFVTGNPFGV